jgi:hypothetical protein
MPKSRSRSAESGQYVSPEQAAANPSTTVQERPPKQRAPLAPLSEEETADLTQIVENAVDIDEVVDYVNTLIARRR